MRDKTHPERDSYIEWYGSEFEPDKVEYDEINQKLVNLKEYSQEIESKNY